MAIERAPRGDASFQARVVTAKALVQSSLGSTGSTVDWNALAERNAEVATTLDPLGSAVVADLLQHAAVLTAVQCHLYFADPLPSPEAWVDRFG